MRRKHPRPLSDIAAPASVADELVRDLCAKDGHRTQFINASKSTATLTVSRCWCGQHIHVGGQNDDAPAQKPK